MGVSRSGYYKHLKRKHEDKIDPDFVIVAKVRQIHSETRGSYGSRRMSRQLRDEGYDTGRYRARSLMKKAGLSVKCRKKFKKTTDSNHKLPVAPNLLNRQFEVRATRYGLVCRYNLLMDHSGLVISGCCSGFVFT
ncbi:MAG: IS3 family transposase [Deltaproteobacteria bacterium]|nr:IS3 family transposase [Deltaproteobacteria bacterium]